MRFPNLPKYLTKVLPRKRSSREPSDNQLVKRLKIAGNEADVCAPISFSITNPDVSIESLCNVQLPTEYWVKVKYEGSPNVVCFLTWDSYTDEICHPDKKVVVEKKTENDFFCSVYIKGVTTKANSLASSSDLQTLLFEVNQYQICNGAGTVDEFSNTLKCTKRKMNIDINNKFVRSKRCLGNVNKKAGVCSSCKYQRKLLLNRRARKSQAKFKSKCENKSKVAQQTAKRLKKQSISLKNKIKFLNVSSNDKLQNCLTQKLNSLSYKQRLAIKECFKASNRKGIKGMIYDKEWLLECIIMRIKSPRLYEHMRINKLLQLPSRTCIKKSLRAYQSGFGFNSKMFDTLKIKVEGMDNYNRHGCILFDELKLSENLQLQADGLIQGYVDYGTYTPAEKMHDLCDHGLVFMFQPFVGDWTQVLGVFATKGNLQGSMLGKLLIEAILLSEASGLFVDAITGDGATWNRAMWREFGIGVSRTGEITCRITHPVDADRYLHFLSDFPHLLKCVRNAFLKNGFLTPDGEVRPEFIKAAHKEDEKTVCLKAMPKITKVHLAPNNFEKMRVNIAFQLFSVEVLKGLYIYKDQISSYGNPEATILFIKKINELIEVMTSREYGKGLRYESSKCEFLKQFLKFLDEWEFYVFDCELGYLSKSTSVGLKVTLSSTLSLIQYLTEKVKYTYLSTSKLSQDKIENFFSIVRQCKGCNDHPTPAEFLTIVEMLSFYNLARPSRGANAQPSVINSLIGINSGKPKEDSPLSAIDTLLNNGNLSEASTLLLQCNQESFSGHEQIVEQKSDERLIYYIAGYAVRAYQRKTSCKFCKLLLEQDSIVSSTAAEYTKAFDKGGLIYPSNKLFSLILEIENKFTKCFSFNELHRESILDVVNSLAGSTLTLVGCSEHQVSLTQKIIKYFVITRLHFYLKQVNRTRSTKRERQKLLKMRRCK